MYEVKTNARGVHRWVPVIGNKKGARNVPNNMTATDFLQEVRDCEFKVVITVDNGDIPFVVFLLQDNAANDRFWWRVQQDSGTLSGPGKAYVFMIDQGFADSAVHEDEESPPPSTNDARFTGMYRFWRAFDYHNAFVGYDSDEIRCSELQGWRCKFDVFSRPHHAWWLGGNTILLQVEPSYYIFIGERVVLFKAGSGDRIVRFVSNMGNSAVPYPYAVGQQRVYFMDTTMSTEDANKGERYIPISAPITPSSKHVPSPMSPSYDDPYHWLWQGIDRQTGVAAKEAGVQKVKGFRELLPKIF